MATKVIASPDFQKRLERYLRKFPAFAGEIAALIKMLEDDERPGNKIPRVGYDVYKTELKNPSAKKGKRKGFRVIYYIRRADYIFLITLYPKNERTDISPEEIRRMVKEVIDSLEDEENGE